MRRRSLLGVSIVLLAVFAYDAVLRSALTDVLPLPAVPGGLKVLTAVLALFSLTHAWYSIGGRLTAAFFLLSATISWGYEQVGVVTGLVFGAYHYTDYLGSRLGEVPLLIPLAWFMMIYPSYVTANSIVEGQPTGTPGGPWRLLRLAAASAVVMTAWDLVVDPILSGPSVKAWVWENGGPYFGIPIQNYLGWLATTFTVYLVYRAIERRWAIAASLDAPIVSTTPAAAPLGRGTAALPVTAYGLMLVADLLTGVAPAGLATIGLVVMGLPCGLATLRLLQVERGRMQPIPAAGRWAP